MKIDLRGRSSGVGRIACAAAVAGAMSVVLSAQYQGWDIPAGGRDEKSPLASSADVVSRGKMLFAAHCERCHGPEGKGNGPASDHAADLTDEYRTDINTEGVLFYKIWNGHAVQLRVQIDDMPAFSDRLTRDDVWSLVEYLKVLRAR